MCPFSHGNKIECDQLGCDDCKIYKDWLKEDDFEYNFFQSYDDDSEDS